MLYRRKLALALLQAFGNHAPLTDFQKLAFLLSQNQTEPSFDFVPYKYGSFSFQLDRDRQRLIELDLLEDKKGWSKKKGKDYIRLLRKDDINSLVKLRKEVGDLRGDDLIKYVYAHYPYYAINSTVASKLLGSEELENVRQAIPVTAGKCLFTIGYEAKSVELFANQLIQNGVRVLLDVRRNPVSRKFGFAKGTLKRIIEKLNISYIHIPELGIESSKRRNLNSKADYDELFDEYAKTLGEREIELDEIMDLVETQDRIALMCYELNPEECHRSRVVEALKEIPKWNYPIQHI